MNYILALDQGTTSSRSLLFSPTGRVLHSAQRPLTQYYPKPGWVEHDPMEILRSQYETMLECVQQTGITPGDIAGVGITNQRETVLIWERATGRPIHPAIVWQCRRTAELCEGLKAQGHAPYILEKTGLPVDAYFSATKLCWMLEQVPGAKARAERGELLCGTVDSWLVWNLTGGAVHVSDYSNCARTMLFDIHKLCWDELLCQLMGVPKSMLPTPVANSGVYGEIAPGIPGLEALAGLKICGMAGDQQAALFGQGCRTRGQVKNTYGTGCFLLMNTGDTPVASKNGLITTIGWSVGGQLCYVLEGSVFNAGSAIQWLRDELKLIESAPECDRLAESVPDSAGVYLVPAFTGLGAPEWDMYARGTIVGLTRGSNRAHLCRAVLESIAYQSADVLDAMSRDTGEAIRMLRVDGGASVSDVLLQFQADLLKISVERPQLVETTAWGAACLAGLACGLEMEAPAPERSFLPKEDRGAQRKQWSRAVQRSLGWAEHES